MDAYTHSILAVIVIAVAYYVGRYMMLRSITLTDDDRLQARRLITVLQAINHMGITPEPKEQEHAWCGTPNCCQSCDTAEPHQLDLFLAEGSTGGTD